MQLIHSPARAVSLLDVLISVSTETDSPNFQLETAFPGQTCLVAVDESDLTGTLMSLLDSTRRTARKHQRYSASVDARDGTVTLTLSEQTAGVQWSLQFPELSPSKYTVV